MHWSSGVNILSLHLQYNLQRVAVLLQIYILLIYTFIYRCKLYIFDIWCPSCDLLINVWDDLLCFGSFKRALFEFPPDLQRGSLMISDISPPPLWPCQLKAAIWPTSAWLHNPVAPAGSPLKHQRHVCVCALGLLRHHLSWVQLSASLNRWTDGSPQRLLGVWIEFTLMKRKLWAQSYHAELLKSTV